MPQAFRCGSCLFNERCVLLGDLIHLRHSPVDLFDPGSLFKTCRGISVITPAACLTLVTTSQIGPDIAMRLATINRNNELTLKTNEPFRETD